MSQQTNGYEQYSKPWKNLEGPFQDFVRLNTETLKEFQTIKPEDLTKISRPDEFFQKQMQMAVANGQKAIKYMEQSLQIFEKAMLAFVDEKKG